MTTDFSKSVPATLKGDQDVRPELKRVISEALGGRKVSLSPDVLTQESRLVIERAPEPLDPYGNPISGRLRMEKPNIFVLKKAGNSCALYHEQSGEYYPLSGVKCAE